RHKRIPMRWKTWSLTSALLVLAVGYWWYQATPERQQAFADIEKHGGRARVERTADGHLGVTVAFNGPRVTDADLASLDGLMRLHILYLHDTQITGPGLAHLEGHSQLQTLSLLDSKVTDAGLAHLKGLDQLRTLILSGTQVSDT